MTPMTFLRPWLPEACEIESNPEHWARISRDDALRARDLGPITIVYPNAGLRAVAWFDAGSPIASGQFHAVHAAAYYRYLGGKSLFRPSVGRLRKPEGKEVELEPLEPLLPEPGEAQVAVEEAGPGLLLARLLDRRGVEPLAGRSYTVTRAGSGETVHEGTLDQAGRLRHQEVPPGDYRVAVGGSRAVPLLVFDPGETRPQIYFLEV